MKDRTHLVLGLIAVIIGVFCGLNGMGRMLFDQKAQGVVIGVVRSGDPPLTRVYYQDRVAFLTKDRRVIAFTDSFEERLAAEYPVGQRVTVYYDPRHPQSATIDAWSNQWEYALAFLIVGVGFVLYSLRGWIKPHLGRRRKAAQHESLV